MDNVCIVVTTVFGLEAVVRRELEQLGFSDFTIRTGRLEFMAPIEAVVTCNLWLRSAERVFIRLAEFTAMDFGVLFDTVNAIDWAQWIDEGASFNVSGRSVQSQLSSVPACQKIVKKAIVEKLKLQRGGDWIEEGDVEFPIDIVIYKDTASILLDTSGTGLHKRSYRTWIGAAPLKETLAAALVQLSFWRGDDRLLIDPFCGSGTIPIEAAMLARNIAPGLQREFCSEEWSYIPQQLWDTARKEAMDAIKPNLEQRILGYDIDGFILDHARVHAENAGVGEDIHFQTQAFTDLSSKRAHGVIITNPPYGIRLSDTPEIYELYTSMPRVFAELPTWSFFVFTGFDDFENIIQQEASRRRKLYNGRLECHYYQFHGPSPDDGRIAREQGVEVKQAFGGLPERTNEQAEIFSNRLSKMARHMRKWPTKRGITCYRLYERDIPEVPLTVDRYADHLHISEYQRPNEHTLAEHETWLEYMATVAGKVLDIPEDHIFVKHRGRQKGSNQYRPVANDAHCIDVEEAGLKFRVNLSDYIDTGLFLDHRVTRGMVRDEAKGKHMLNLFAYTGSFSVYAAAGGAASTTTVDLSYNYVDWAQWNMRANGFTDESCYHFVRHDAVSFLETLGPEDIYDLAVVDPPTFSNSKSTENDWDVQKDHVLFLNKLATHMSPGGVVYFSNNFRRFKLDEFALKEKYDIRDISSKTVPEDFRNKRIHQCWRIVVK
jgi:23S rRNA (guanine2445-N2)-methyltransferase / 23S rRNA (guanine2069-N7)-methyltransferase